jgi:hypothetical protein
MKRICTEKKTVLVLLWDTEDGGSCEWCIQNPRHIPRVGERICIWEDTWEAEGMAKEISWYFTEGQGTEVGIELTEVQYTEYKTK